MSSKTSLSSDLGLLPLPTQMMESLHDTCTLSQKKGCRILVDAERHHFLPGIHATTLNLMPTFNRDSQAHMFNTHQAYLKSTPDTLAEHLQIARNEKFTLGLKLVRGAYIASGHRVLIQSTEGTERQPPRPKQHHLQRHHAAIPDLLDFGL